MCNDFANIWSNLSHSKKLKMTLNYWYKDWKAKSLTQQQSHCTLNVPEIVQQFTMLTVFYVACILDRKAQMNGAAILWNLQNHLALVTESYASFKFFCLIQENLLL